MFVLHRLQKEKIKDHESEEDPGSIFLLIGFDGRRASNGLDSRLHVLHFSSSSFLDIRIICRVYD